MPGKPTTVSTYIASLPKERREAIQALRKVIRANLDDGYIARYEAAFGDKGRPKRKTAAKKTTTKKKTATKKAARRTSA